MIEAIKLTKSFKGKKAVEEVDLYMDPGESVGLLGPNGAGKSTTISMISSLIKPTSGDVKFQGQSIHSNPGDLRKILGVVPQEIALYEELSAYENLKFFGRLYKVDKSELESRIQSTLEIVGLTNRQKDLIKTFSGGMKRRINIAAALLHNPKVIILDEPTVGIDPQSRYHILEMVKEMREKFGTTILYTSHYMEEVEQLCERIYIMDHGRVIASGTQSELLSILSEEETIQIQVDFVSPSLKEVIQEIEAVRHVEEVDGGLKIIAQKSRSIVGALVRVVEKENAELLNFQMEKPSLEDVFLHLTGRTLRD